MVKRITVALVALAALALPAAAGAQTGPMPVPNNLAPPSGNVLLFKTFASGDQIYVCTERAGAPGAFEWTFKAPEALLWNETGEQVGTHYAGPTWEGNDRSRVVGEVLARADAPVPGAIPWLLLRAKTNHGRGIFSSITYIQRLETTGGVAPSGGCDHSSEGAERAVPYTAVYAFYFGAAH